MSSPAETYSPITRAIRQSCCEGTNLKIGLDDEPLFMRILRGSVVGIVPGELGAGDDSDIVDAEIVGDDEISWER